MRRLAVAAFGARRLTTPILIGCVVLLVALKTAKAIGAYSHNDHMYVGAAVLALKFPLYAETAFVQTPLSIFLYQLDYLAFGEPGFFFACRVSSALLALASVGLLAATVFVLSGGRVVLALLTAIILLTNGPFMSAANEVGNYSLSLALASASVFCLGCWQTPGARVLGGLLAGLSVSAKLSFLCFCAGVPVASYAWSGRLRDLSWLVLGIALGGLPIVYFLVRCPHEFLFLTVTFHHLTNVYRHTRGWSEQFSIARGVAMILLSLGPLLACAGFAIGRRPSLRPQADRRGAIAIAVLIVAAVAGAVSPMIFFKNYWSLPVGLIVAASLLVIARRPNAPAVMNLLVVAGVGFSLLHAGRDLRKLVSRPLGSSLAISQAVSEVRHGQDEFKASIAPFRDCLSDVLTPIAPLVLASGVPLATGSSAGPFLFRLDEVVTKQAPAYRRYTDFRRFIGPRTAILVGYYPEEPFEDRMVSYVQSRGYVRRPTIRFQDRDLLLYVPEACAVAVPSQSPGLNRLGGSALRRTR